MAQTHMLMSLLSVLPLRFASIIKCDFIQQEMREYTVNLHAISRIFGTQKL
jgi:hypothetical protein